MLQAACRFRTQTQPRVEPPLHRPPRQAPRPCHRRLSRDPPAATVQRPASSRGARSSTARVAREAASRAPSPESPEKVLLCDPRASAIIRPARVSCARSPVAPACHSSIASEFLSCTCRERCLSRSFFKGKGKRCPHPPMGILGGEPLRKPRTLMP